MIRSILVPLDGSRSAQAAGERAAVLAERTGAQLHGLGVLDSPWITQPQAIPIGGAAYKFARDLAILKTTHERIEAVLERFRTTAQAAGVASVIIAEVEGDPARHVAAAATAHDLVVVGRDTDFHFGDEGPEGVPRFIEELLHDASRPVLLVPSRIGSGMNDNVVLVAFDGSAPASRALHIFALLGLGDRCETHVVTIDENADEADRIAERACVLLRRHGIASVRPIGLRRDGDPSATLESHAKSLRAGTIVMGAFGHRGWSETLFGSCTQRVVRRAATPLFIHH